jgi:hypothetical protein
MSVICSKCFDTKVSCEASVNPNTKEFIGFTDDSFEYGWCEVCGEGLCLIDTDQTIADIDAGYNKYRINNNKEPVYASGQVNFRGDEGIFQNVVIKLSLEVGEDDDKIFYNCKDIDELKELATPTSNDFLLTGFFSFS